MFLFKYEKMMQNTTCKMHFMLARKFAILNVYIKKEEKLTAI